MIGVGIERAKELADRSNEELMSTLEETLALSRSAMWELRHPMEIGEIFEGMELGGVLESLAATFSTISSIPADLMQSGVEPPLPESPRGAEVLRRVHGHVPEFVCLTHPMRAPMRRVAGQSSQRRGSTQET